MTTNQPRDEDGKFTLINTRAVHDRNDDDTVGLVDESEVTPAVDWANVDIDYLQESIDRVQSLENVIRIGVVSKHSEDNGRHTEDSMVFVKGKPSDSEMAACVGLTREWFDE